MGTGITYDSGSGLVACHQPLSLSMMRRRQSRRVDIKLWPVLSSGCSIEQLKSQSFMNTFKFKENGHDGSSFFVTISWKNGLELATYT